MDQVYRKFLEHGHEQVTRLATASDVLDIEAEPFWPPARYRCIFHVPYLRLTNSGVVERDPGPVLALLHIPADYLHPADKYLYLRIASVYNPGMVHPNISPAGNVCLGAQLKAGTPVHALLHQLADIVSYRNCGLHEANSFNPVACRLLRQHGELRRQLQSAPLIRRNRKLQIQVEEI